VGTQLKQQYIISIISISSLLILGLLVYVEAQTRTITLDNSNRREYTYCPLSDSEIKSLNAEINGCPLVRIYVNDWNKLTSLEQTAIDTLLRGKGFVDSGEHILK